MFSFNELNVDKFTKNYRFKLRELINLKIKLLEDIQAKYLLNGLSKTRIIEFENAV